MNNTYESFSHGLITSKIWLCEELENIMHNRAMINPAVNVLGSWHNTLPFMMLVRKPKYYGVFNCYDLDSDAVDMGNQVCDTWKYEYPKVYSHVADASKIDFTATGNESIFINCSVDQFAGVEWYDKIPDNRLVCLQTTDLNANHELWEIKQSSSSIIEFTERYRVSTLLYSGQKKIEYPDLSYTRYMMIGIK
jgi:hypothetical protein